MLGQKSVSKRVCVLPQAVNCVQALRRSGRPSRHVDQSAVGRQIECGHAEFRRYCHVVSNQSRRAGYFELVGIKQRQREARLGDRR